MENEHTNKYFRLKDFNDDASFAVHVNDKPIGEFESQEMIREIYLAELKKNNPNQ